MDLSTPLIVFVWLCCAFGAAAVARNRGEEDANWFLYGLVFGPLAVILRVSPRSVMLVLPPADSSEPLVPALCRGIGFEIGGSRRDGQCYTRRGTSQRAGDYCRGSGGKVEARSSACR